MEVKAKVPELNVEVVVEYDLGANLDEAVTKFGPDAVYLGFLSSATIDLQSILRGLARAVKEDGSHRTVAEIQAEVSEWKPGTSRREKADPFAGVLKKFNSMTPEKQQEFIQKLLSNNAPA